MDTTNQMAADSGTVASNSSAADTLPPKIYPTKADAEAAAAALTDRPKSLKAMELSKNGTVVGWVMCRGYSHGLEQAARIEGYSLSTGVKAAPITKEAAAAKVLEMSDDEFRALVAARKAAAKKS